MLMDLVKIGITWIHGHIKLMVLGLMVEQIVQMVQQQHLHQIVLIHSVALLQPMIMIGQEMLIQHGKKQETGPVVLFRILHRT